MNLSNLFWIGIGGALGSMLRFSIQYILPYSQNTFPKATFLTNIVASFIVGIISGLLSNKFPDNTILKYFLLIGFCGGFSTFSTFILEIHQLNGQANFFTSFIYVFSSLTVAAIALFLGLWLSKTILS